MDENKHSDFKMNKQKKGTATAEVQAKNNTKSDKASASKSKKDKAQNASASKQTERLRGEIEQLREEKKESQAEVLRGVAEIQTLRRRSAMEVQKARLDGVAELALGLTETVDNLERALTTMKTQKVPADACQGVQLTYESLLRCLESFDIKRVEPLGEEFNPEYHQAIGRIKQEGKASNQVVEVVQTGYQMGNNGRLIRPAMVKVAE